MNEIDIIKTITFYGFSIFIIIFALLTVFANRILYSLIFAVITFFSVAGIFFSLGADYNAVVQIAVYGVAVPVIFLFAIMFTSKVEDRLYNIALSPRFITTVVSVPALFIILWYFVKLSIHLNSNSLKIIIPMSFFCLNIIIF